MSKKKDIVQEQEPVVLTADRELPSCEMTCMDYVNGVNSPPVQISIRCSGYSPNEALKNFKELWSLRPNIKTERERLDKSHIQ